MTNDLIFLTIILIDLGFVLVASKLGKDWLFVAIVLNLLMVSIFGPKLVTRFGFISNTGNIFYACVFFATQLLVVNYGRKEAEKSILLGLSAVVLFIVLSQLNILTTGIPETRAVNNAISTLFQAAPRIAIASIVAYLASQIVNINLFSYLYQKFNGEKIYLQVNLTNIAGQAVDSLIFFVVAFYGTIPNAILLQTLLVGYIIKVAVGSFSGIFFYLSNSNENKI